MKNNPKSSEPPTESADWVRMPLAGEDLCGIGRTTLYNLFHAGEIQLVSVKRSGRESGRTLVYLPSLTAYLERLRCEQNPQAARQ